MSARGAGIETLAELLRSLEPELDPAQYVFLTAAAGIDVSTLDPIGTFGESEGTTLIVDVAVLETAHSLGCRPEEPPRMALITLRVHSSLLAVGLTAAVATVLAGAGISCNVVAGYFHDHLFVPVDDAGTALELLRALSS